MNEFKVGDTVEVKENYLTMEGYLEWANSQLKLGAKYIVKEIKSEKCILIEHPGGGSNTYGSVFFNLAWTPKKGDLIEVSDDKDFRGSWNEEFRGMFEGRYMGKNPEQGDYTGWEYARPIEDRTITFADGRKVELSEESYKAMRGED